MKKTQQGKVQAQSASNVNSPKSISTKTDKAGKPIRKARRRLSVVSDNALIEGLSEMAVKELEDAEQDAQLVVTEYAGFSKKGYAPYNERKKNQDSLIMAEADLSTKNHAILLGVLDGHGEQGEKVSQYFKKRLPALIFNNRDFIAKPDDCMIAALKQTERGLLSDRSIDTSFSGSTCVLAVIKGDEIYVANIGDSRIVVGRKNKETGETVAIEVSIDHKPELPAEKERILGQGGRVFAVEYDDGIDGPQRVWLGNMDVPGLAMSRSLGDTVAKSVGVISVPEIFKYNVDEDDVFCIIASDGLWEFINNQEAVDLIKDKQDPKSSVDILVQKAFQKWNEEEEVVDDITVAVAYLKK